MHQNYEKNEFLGGISSKDCLKQLGNRYSAGLVNAMSATASRRPPWQNPRRRRQAAAGAGLLLLGYLVLFFVALLGGPRIGAGFLPLPGGGPEPAVPIAGPQPGEPTQNVAVLPPRTTATPAATPGVTPNAVTTPLPTATKPGEVQVPVGLATPDPTSGPGTPTPQIVQTTEPTIPVATKRPPTAPPSTDPTATPSGSPTPSTTPTAPPTSSTPSTPPPTPDDPDQPGGLGGILGHLLDKLGL
jgi:hypothetical protein